MPDRPRSSRLIALDALRGLTMLAMVLVNNPGSWSHVYPPLRHAEWNGCTPTDLVFPFFLFVVGASMAFSMDRWRGPSQEPSADVKPSAWPRILRRAAVIAALGLFLNAFPFTDLSHLRITGVLQRIAVAYLLASALVMLSWFRFQVAFASVILVGYTVLLLTWPAIQEAQAPQSELLPGGHALESSRRSVTEQNNPCRFLDLSVVPLQHLYSRTPTDPEGLLGSLPGTVTVLIGYWIGGVVARTRRAGAPLPLFRLWMLAAALLVAGWLSGLLVPFNKPLWTPSYVLWTAGWATASLAALLWAIDARRWIWLGHPLEIAGRNAILLFVGSGLLGRILGLIKVGIATAGAEPAPLKQAIYEAVFVPMAGANATLGSLLYAVANILLWWAILWVCYRRRWFLVA